ncbi:magnesium-protoporphyrin IX monomethyl ester aerobic oxidative cyclase [Luminiphilus syltensis NOR5-1B]|uniref:Aerobic magnesium-protoporphyrin IX monomethyl ester [oxidative] cyclase n=1 Tax=Luminiphilus syltensis NOR5-1B TaxID=565045 RepID=B8KT46_9GAMM|nr:magnesium-protoporphyrin IX monomethyl ester (oxidative) cyclase [Luminiphilus syltensis]EED34334.1 magnesium-protoporphyrin IX monomethyl ester aerobic oxidative cyclase [Luminiphilus syltensis NOR5-1B]
MTQTDAEIIEHNESTQQALESRMLAPRFYKTDYKALDKLDIEPVRAQWDAMMADFAEDKNRAHFKKTYDFDPASLDSDPELKEEFLDLLVSSITAEYSGCVLYQEIQKHTENPDMERLMRYMARDESRHAGFINKALNQMSVAVDLSELKKKKEYTFFKPKYILYATYLSEKIGYARYITIFRHLERNPENRFHPIFSWFYEWCNDEFAHGEAFALLMRANPYLLRGHNKLWIRFFLLAVYSTMYVRDHTRPKLYEAFGMDVTEFDYRVFDICTAITRQVFPLTLNTDDPRFRRGLDRMLDLSLRTEALRQQKGVLPRLKQWGLMAATGVTFAKLYFLPVESNELPAEARMAPAW